MSTKNIKTEGGINITGGRVSVGGDLVGRDKIVTTTITSKTEITAVFQKFIQVIEDRPDEQNVDKDELKDTIQKIEAEVKKGEQANPSKVERWLKFLAVMAEDIFEVVTTTLANPIAGVAKSIQLIARKARQEAAKSA